MDDKQQGSISELKDYQMGCSWFPPTPAKPGLTRRQPICTEWQDNQAFESQKFSLVNEIGQAEFYPTGVSEFASRCDSINGVNTRGVSNIREASMAGFHVKKDDLCFNKFRSTFSFRKLLARAHASGTTAAEYARSENSSLRKFAVESNCMPNITSASSSENAVGVEGASTATVLAKATNIKEIVASVEASKPCDVPPRRPRSSRKKIPSPTTTSPYTRSGRKKVKHDRKRKS